jgi:hypothetical protein
MEKSAGQGCSVVLGSVRRCEPFREN